jgi:hypothetical protein
VYGRRPPERDLQKHIALVGTEPPASMLMDKHADLLKARPELSDQLRKFAQPPVGLRDRTASRVEPLDRCNKSRVDPWRRGDHDSSLAAKKSRHGVENATKWA